MRKGMLCLCAVTFFMWWPLANAFIIHAGAKDEEMDSTFSKIPVADLPKRPIFLFVHMEKSAGSFLFTVFQNALGENMLGYHYPEKALDGVPQNYFVVSSIRNPCSQVLSAWSYCCEKAWVLKNLGIFDSAAKCGEFHLEHGLCPQFTGNKTAEKRYNLKVNDLNANGFHTVVEQPTSALYEMQFNRTFSAVGYNRVNCWVTVENIEADAHKCVNQYVQMTGYDADLSALTGKFKNNKGHHSSCNSYYSPRAEEVVHRHNSYLFNYFGYGPCCGE